jgi:hypothetical protein
VVFKKWFHHFLNTTLPFLSCRVYATPQGMRGVPTGEMLREKIQTLKFE